MKKLLAIILLFVAGCASAQSAKKKYAIEMLSQYMIDCYNDSTLVSVKPPPKMDVVEKYKFIKENSKYIHRPPTFDGFKEWIKKQ